ARNIASDPEAAMKLKQLEFEHYDSLNKMVMADIQSARQREEKIVELTGHRDWLLDVITCIVIAGYFILCGLVLFNKVSDENSQVLYMMIGQLTGGFIMVLSYYFGSSKPSNTSYDKGKN